MPIALHRHSARVGAAQDMIAGGIELAAILQFGVRPGPDVRLRVWKPEGIWRAVIARVRSRALDTRLRERLAQRAARILKLR